MFGIGKRKIYNTLLSAEGDARQIRNRRNLVVAENARGHLLFGDTENPFVFFKDTEDTSPLKKLQDAYCQHIDFTTQIRLPQRTFEVRIKRIKHQTLLIAQDITPQSGIFNAMKNQMSVLADIVHTFSDPLYLINAQGVLVYTNPEFCRLIGRPFQELLGYPLNNLIVDNTIETDLSFKGDITFQTTDGTLERHVFQYPLETEGEPVFCGILKSTSPGTTTTTPFIIDNSPLPAAVLDASTQKIMQANAAFYRLINNENKRPFIKLLEDDSQIALKKQIERLTAGSITTGAESISLHTLPTFGGRILNAYLGFASPQQDTLLLYLIDASDQRNMETQMVHAQKMQAIGQLAGGIAHDFNNLLTAILGFCDLLLQRHPVNDPDFSDLMQIKGNASRAGSLVGQLLTFSRKKPMQERMISVHDSFVDLSALLQRSLAPNCTLKTEYKRNLGCIKLDPNQLTQIFLNLAVNARDAMPKGGVFKLTLSKEKVKKSRPVGSDTITPGDYLKIMAVDEGMGMSPKDLSHIFEPFFTTKRNSTTSGTGLGLSTVYGIVHSVGGFITADSVQNVGTTFTIYLPRFEPVEGEISSPVVELKSTLLAKENTPVLLVDDEDSIRAVSCRALRAKGFEVIECANAEQALDTLKTRNDIQLLITDMVMPGMDGETLINQVKKKNKDLKTLLMSGYSAEFERHTSAEEQGFDFLAKPFTLAQFLEKVKEVLEK